MRRPLECAAWLASAVLTIALPGCGGGSDGGGGNPSGPSTPTTTRRLLQSGNFSLVGVPQAQRAGFPADAGSVDVSVSSAGAVDITVDWTFTSNPVGFGLYRSPCSFNQFYADQCSVVGQRPATTSKPATLSIPSVASGNYVFFIVNAGNTSESGTYQIFLTN